jgi:hypothetical protein
VNIAVRPAPLMAVLLAGLLPACLSAAPLDEVRDCAAHASPGIVGLAGLSAVCPQLESALRSSGLEAILGDGWRDQLTSYSLRDYADLAQRYSGAKPRGSADVAALPGILESMARERTPLLQSRWQLFKDWLNAWLARHAGALHWLDRWLAELRLSAALGNVIQYSLIILAVGGAVAVVVNELRAAGRFRRRGRAASQPPYLDSSSAAPENEAETSPALAERLAALLRLLVQRLVQSGRLQRERSLTHRELVARSSFDSESQREVFAAVAGTAEILLYGPQGAAPPRLDGIYQDGQALLTQLTRSGAH